MDAAGETFPINSGHERPELQVIRLDLEHSDALPMARFWHDSRALKVRASRQFGWRLRSCDRPWRPAQECWRWERRPRSTCFAGSIMFMGDRVCDVGSVSTLIVSIENVTALRR